MTRRVSPLYIQIAIAYRCCVEPHKLFETRTWSSPAATEVRERLVLEGMVVGDNEGRLVGSAKLDAWVDELCATPLPTERTSWVIER